MSNQAVGNVYQIIIDDVINSSRVDFEESGIDETALEELRQVRNECESPLLPFAFPSRWFFDRRRVHCFVEER